MIFSKKLLLNTSSRCIPEKYHRFFLPRSKKPMIPAVLLIFVFSIVSPALYAQDPPGDYPVASIRLLLPGDMEGKQLVVLRIMRNEIFARHGHIFKSEDLKKHFGSQDWYKPTQADATSLLTEVEKENIDFIKRWENRIATTGDFDTFFERFSKAVSANNVNELFELASSEGFESVSQFTSYYKNHSDDIAQVVAGGGYPDGNDTTKKLSYGEFYNGVQYQWVEFQKQGCCWYIYAFRRAG